MCILLSIGPFEIICIIQVICSAFARTISASLLSRCSIFFRSRIDSISKSAILFEPRTNDDPKTYAGFNGTSKCTH